VIILVEGGGKREKKAVFSPWSIKMGSPVSDGIVSPAVALPAVQLLAGGTICLANRTAAISGGVSRQFPERLKMKVIFRFYS
jgi:hypothetical protein